MKKALSISLILTLLLSLSACGTSNAAKGTAAVKTVESQPQVETENKKEDKKDEEVTVVQPAAKTEPTEQISTQTTTKAVQQSTSSTTVKQSTKPTPTPTPAPTHQLNTSYNEWYNIRNSNNTTPGIPSLIKPWMGKYNAIFITKDNFSEASNAEYAPIYRKSKIPFYFIDNEKSHVNFIEEDLSYEDEPDFNDGMYIDGVLYIKDKHWGYGLYNDTKSETNIKAVYSRVFEDISKIKNNKLP
jgi:hypothetical protein